MKEWEGKLAKKHSRDWNGTMLYSFKLEGVDRFFRTGKENPLADVPEGAYIQFTERNSTVQNDSVTVLEREARTEKPKGEVVDQVRPGQMVETPKDDIGERIRWQNARRDACNVVVAALHTDALPWAANTAKGKKLDLLVGYINRLTKQFLEDEETRGEEDGE